MAVTFYRGQEWQQYCWYRQRHTAAYVAQFVGR